MKIGVLLCVYQDYEFINECLQPWVEFRRINDSPIDVKIAVTHGQFIEYNQLGFPDEDIKTIEKLKLALSRNIIDYLYIQNDINSVDKKYQNEAALRNHGLKYLLNQDIDYFWTLGADEIYTVKEIQNIINKIQEEKFCDWFRIHHKNYVIDTNHYVRGFCPPRIWDNRKHGGIDKFYWDDDIVFKDGSNYKDLPCYIIPEKLAFINHYTWLSNEKSKNKILYHEKHFSHGAGCSYKWNDIEDKLELNLEYYKRIGQNPPEIFTDEI